MVQTSSPAVEPHTSEPAHKRGLILQFYRPNRKHSSTGTSSPWHRLRRIVFIAGIILLIIATLTGAGLRIINNTVAQTSGTFYLPGLLAPVTVTRDAYGVPHIIATNQQDLDYAQGFTTVQDRGYQMEQLLRLVSGQLSAVYGPGPNQAYLQTDIFFRSLDFDAASKAEYAQLARASRKQLIAYTDGINAAIQYQTRPVEDTLGGSVPLHWQPWYPLEIGRLVSFGFSDWYIKLVAGRTGPQSSTLFQQAFPDYPASNPTILAPAPAKSSQTTPAASTTLATADLLTQTLSHLPQADLEAYARIADISGIIGGHLGSNNWVLDGSLTKSGGAIEAGDPHVPVELPGFWYQIGLTVQAYPTGPISEDAIGASIPGIPGIILGQNSWAAWSLTIADVSSENLYVLSQTGCPTTEYQYNGICVPFQIRNEIIPVSGQHPYHLSIYTTQQGAVVLPTDLPITATSVAALPSQYQHVLALRSTLFNPDFHISNVFALATMSSWSNFLAATNNVPLGINWLIGTKSGQIGYRMSGILPLQPQQALYEPVDGTTSATIWKGYVPQSQMPRLINPRTVHELVTANNPALPVGSALQVGGYPDQGYRAARISQLLRDIPAGTATAADMETIQNDVTSIPAQILTPFFTQAGQSAGGLASQAAALLSGWNGQVASNSIAAAIYEVTLANLVRDVMQPRLGTALYQTWVYASPDEGSGPTATGIAIAQYPQRYFGTATSTTASIITARDRAIAKAESEAFTTLTTQFGANTSSWTWGKLHQINLGETGLTTIPVIGQAFAIPSTGRPGDENTVDQGGNYDMYLAQPNYSQTYAPVYRQIIDLGDSASSVWILGAGASGQPFSSHFADQFPLWNRGTYVPMTNNPTTIKRSTSQTLLLTP